MAAQSIYDFDLPSIEAVEGVSRSEFEADIRPAGRPIILKGIAKDWPVVAASQRSREVLASYLKSMDVGAVTPTFIAPPAVKGRYFYSDDMSGFTFESRDVPIAAIIDKLLEQESELEPHGIYAGASPTSNAFPRFGEDNPMPMLPETVVPKIWISNSATIAPHFDVSENIACLVSGERRFVVFPPDQISNLYVGPIDYNMAGQPASMVDLHRIDEERFPQFAEAAAQAQLAVLEPGDAIYLPSLWWHFVESKGPFNVLVNYWWSNQDNGSPMNALALALLVLRDLPENDRAAWETVFKHYVFGPDAEKAVDHIPEQFQGVLGKNSPGRNKRIKTFLRAQLANVLR
ncbi:MAG: cupin-like domain-containing protein [Pseudomonadota bacterium]